MSRTQLITALECPDCGGELKRTLDSRQSSFSGQKTIRRKKVCQMCGNYHFTIEMPVSAMNRVATRSIMEIVNSDQRMQTLLATIFLEREMGVRPK